MMQAQLADGRILEFPDGTDTKVIQSTVKKMIAQGQPQSITESKPEPVNQGWQYDDQGYSETAQEEQDYFHNQGTVGGMVEPALTLGSAIVAEPVAGVAGIAQALNPFADKDAGTRAVESTREALTYQPSSEGGKKILGEVAQVAEPLGKAITAVEQGMGDFAFDLTGSPAVAAAAATAPTMLGEILGLKGLRALRTGEKLLDASGRPTRMLRIELNKAGLDFDSMAKEVQDLIPERVKAGVMPGSKPVRAEVENAVIGQINAGAKDNALASLKVVNGKLKADPSGIKAVKQGFRDGFVQSVKTSNPATKAKMRLMLQKMRGIKKNERMGLDTRPYDVAGDSITERIGYIRDVADEARKELDHIASKTLRGKEIDPAHVMEILGNSLDDLDVNLIPDANGIIKPDFNGSIISKDRSSQRVIKDMVDLLGEGGAPDALRFHKLKRQLDVMIDFNKKSAMGLSDAGKGVLKDVRRALNDSLRSMDADYAKVNDTLSTSLASINDLDKAVGSIDIFGAGSNKALGTKMRALMSNQAGRVKIENAIDQINEATKKLGGNFTDDMKDLVMFADGLDDRFGTTARTSFAGQTEQAVSQAMRQNPKATVLDSAAKKVAKGANKLRGVNDFNAYEALDALLNP